jgi:ribokinase
MWTADEGRTGAWTAAPVQGSPIDDYGCGDAFAAGLTFGLAAGLPLAASIGIAARCGAAAICGRGPYDAQLTAADLQAQA